MNKKERFDERMNMIETIKLTLNYIKVCWRMKDVLPFVVRFVDLDTPLTKEQYNYPTEIMKNDK